MLKLFRPRTPAITMRFGCCTDFSGSEDDLASVDALQRAGFDYFEPSADCVRADGDPEAYYALRRSIRRAPLIPEAVALRMPADMPVVGDDVNWPTVERHLALSLDRIEEIGAISVALDATAGARPASDYPRDEAQLQLRYLLNMAADYAGALTIALDPRSLGEDDPHSIERTAELIQQLGRAEVRMLLSLHARDWSEERGRQIERSAKLLQHVHLHTGCAGLSGDGEDGNSALLRALATGGYDGRVSIVPGTLADVDFGTMVDALRGHTNGRR